jgi:NADH-quinone oxidoreductase subunit A
MSYPNLPSTEIVAYLALFAAVGAAFVFGCLMLGWFLRPRSPSPQKQAIYECGEPAVGSGSVQFDLRFYVVALLFLIFEVEVLFLFPPAAIFGRAAGRVESRESRVESQEPRVESKAENPESRILNPESLNQHFAYGLSPDSARRLALMAMIDMGVFFAVLLAGFAYLWRRGDLDWVRAVRPPVGERPVEPFTPRLRHGD